MKKIHELTREEMNSPRYMRARRFADTMLSLTRHFIPHDRMVQRYFLEQMLEAGWEANVEIINVPEIWDALNKIQIEKAMIEAHPLYIKADDILQATELPGILPGVKVAEIARRCNAFPDLLDALKQQTAALIAGGYHPESKAIADARAAIKKATP